MKVYKAWCAFRDEAGAQNFVEKVDKHEDFEAVLLRENKEIKKRFKKLGIKLARSAFEGTGFELVTKKKSDALIGLGWESEEPDSLQIVALASSAEEIDEIEQSIKKIAGLEIINSGVCPEQFKAEELNKLLKKQSPNGKIVNNKKYEEVFKIAFDNKSRRVVKRILETYGTLPVPLSFIEKANPRDKAFIQDLAKKATALIKKYRCACKKCGFPAEIIFDSKESANEAMKRFTFVCAECEKKEMRVVETYCVNEELRGIIRQGAWLEKLVSDSSSKASENVWVGRVFENNEVDVVCLTNGETVLFECKDTEIGQNDFYVLLEKARNLSADLVVVVTTRKIHSNVKGCIDRYNSQGPRRIYVIENSKAEKISKEVSELLLECDERFLKRFFGRSGVRRRLIARRRYFKRAY